MAGQRGAWIQASRKALLGWTCWVVGCFLAFLTVDLISEGPERFTTAYFIARPVVFGVGWFGGVLVIRWWARRPTGELDGSNDSGS